MRVNCNCVSLSLSYIWPLPVPPLWPMRPTDNRTSHNASGLTVTFTWWIFTRRLSSQCKKKKVPRAAQVLTDPGGDRLSAAGGRLSKKVRVRAAKTFWSPYSKPGTCEVGRLHISTVSVCWWYVIPTIVLIFVCVAVCKYDMNVDVSIFQWS